MHFQETELRGAWLVELTPIRDERGFFSRTFCTQEFASHGLWTRFEQHSISYSRQKGTVRGLHFQRSPYAEVKIVSCQKGAIWDVIVDLRPESPTFGRWKSFEITEQNYKRLYIPRGFAHGFQSLVDEVEINYLISDTYVPEASAGYRYNDPAFNITWPLPPAAISGKDQSWPDFAAVNSTPAVALH